MPNEPESTSLPSCSFSFSFGTGAADANDPDAATHQTSAIMKANSRWETDRGKDNFTVILLFRNDRGKLGMNLRPRYAPQSATYARSQRKGRLDLYRRLRQSRLPHDRTAAGTHGAGRTRYDHLFAKAVSPRPPDCAARVRATEYPEIQRAKAAATPCSLVARTFRPQARPPCRVPEIPSDREEPRLRPAETHVPPGPEKSPQWVVAHETRFGHPDPQNPNPAVGQVPAPRWSCQRP